jgi:hypothetical protein
LSISQTTSRGAARTCSPVISIMFLSIYRGGIGGR